MFVVSLLYPEIYLHVIIKAVSMPSFLFDCVQFILFFTSGTMNFNNAFYKILFHFWIIWTLNINLAEVKKTKRNRTKDMQCHSSIEFIYKYKHLQYIELYKYMKIFKQNFLSFFLFYYFFLFVSYWKFLFNFAKNIEKVK